jgi:acetyl-CoA C-acetyltransferase
MESSAVWIVAACRTPQGRFLGGLGSCSAAQLGVAAARAAMERASVSPNAIGQVIVGNVLSAGAGQNIARQVALGAGVPEDAPAFTVNMMCASGLQAVALAARAIAAGEADAVLCGGAESMSNAPHLLERSRAGIKLGNGTLVDSLLRDGLVDAFSGKHMGECVEALALARNISRARQDAFALLSQQRAAQGREALAAEIVPVGKVTADEHPRADTTLESLAALKPVFDPHGTVTAGNASGINDGAAMLVLASAETARRRGWKPLARWVGAKSAGCAPEAFALGPVAATRALCQHIGCDVSVFDAVELNEAFAAQALACIDDLGLDPARVNTHGGAIALGHPIGASGARLAVHLAHRIAAGGARRALATLCVGGGMGIAAMLEACA